ncbi:hypothetical protein [Ulvibacter litoralis]|uniref:Bulb-type lectin domain-containing protein n=1 Tax=Ulvibacter litoralis TaxID=227084 RepID=A0A1G7DQR4_9FLAO|nr:hypothetical protein [Ulvibacter litoralis]GHC42627.1 lipoprotein [Ulvibacter litoralis]SDE53847.1 hypothetical protein SAMN05421855_1011117 [Ulvibacter litoralis]
MKKIYILLFVFCTVIFTQSCSSSDTGEPIEETNDDDVDPTDDEIPIPESWQKTIGGSGEDALFPSIKTSDNGYLIGGTSDSNISGDKEENTKGMGDYWVVKLDASGVIEWQKTIGGSDQDFLYAIKETLDGGYILGGFSVSNLSGDKTENSNGGRDYWVVKLTNNGIIEWQNTIGGSDSDILSSIVVSNDGGFLLSGFSSSNISGDKTENSRGRSDYWIVKIDSSGNVEWDKTIGGSSIDSGSAAISTNDGGYIIGGNSGSGISGDKTEAGLGLFDYWIVKINSQGDIIWQKTIGGANDDILNTICKTSDNGFILGGHSASDISETKSENAIGITDYWILKLNNSGVIEWDNTIGGSQSDELWSVSETIDQGFIIGGNSNSNISGDKTENSKGGLDYWVLKLTASGNIDWQNTIGGENEELLRSIIEISEGDYFLAGTSSSNISGDKTEDSRGGNDFWVVKL